MIVFLAVFLLYLIVLIIVALVFILMWRPLNPPDRCDGRIVMGEQDHRELPAGERTTYPSPCLSCTNKVDPLSCPGCSELRKQ